MKLFHNIFRLAAGDFLAKTLYFLTFMYLARVLGVATYGTLEFALSILSYFLLLGDGGLEVWATREVAHGKSIAQLVAQVVPLQLLLASIAYLILWAILPTLADSHLQTVVLLLGLTLLSQAVNLRWVFMGREQMGQVSRGLITAQLLFSVSVFALVHKPEDLLWVPLLRLVGDLGMVIYFGRLFWKTYGKPAGFTLRGVPSVLRSSLTIGAAHWLGLMSYNFDSVLLGFWLGPTAVGWYNVAYRPITAVLAMPVSYFLGLLPVLARTYKESQVVFHDMVLRSLRLMTLIALPVGVGGTLLAPALINFLFGPTYANSVLPLQILAWSATFVILRGTYRQALNAVGRPDLDLRCASLSIATNVALNFLLISRYGINGAALATLLSDALWLAALSYYFHRKVAPLHLRSILLLPAAAAAMMAGSFLLTQSLFWMVQALIGGVVYVAVLIVLGESEVRSFWDTGRDRLFRSYSV
ncbi:flippase [soil metagenome]